MFSLPEEERDVRTSSKRMGIKLHNKLIDDMQAFPQKVRVLNYCGFGEPLLEPELPEMISYAVKKNVAYITEVITNGLLLTPEMSNKLADSGLTRLKISVQGLNSATYEKFSGVKVDYDKIVNNVRYFYEHRKNVKLFVKTMEEELEGRPEQEFFDVFGDICDDISIEHLNPAYKKIDFTGLLNGEANVTMLGNEIPNHRVCHRPFIAMSIHSDGKVDPCCFSEIPGIIGDINNESIVDIWNGKKANRLRYIQLTDKNKNEVCGSCRQYQYTATKEDNLDNISQKIIDKFKV